MPAAGHEVEGEGDAEGLKFSLTGVMACSPFLQKNTKAMLSRHEDEASRAASLKLTPSEVEAGSLAELNSPALQLGKVWSACISWSVTAATADPGLALASLVASSASLSALCYSGWLHPGLHRSGDRGTRSTLDGACLSAWRRAHAPCIGL